MIPRDMIPSFLVTRALRRIHLEMRYNGLQGQNFQHLFPQLADCSEFEDIRELLEFRNRPEGQYVGKAQLVYQWPDATTRPLVYHTDVPPEGKVFTAIYGVALTYWYKDNGSLRFDDGTIIECEPGTVVHIPPEAHHTSGFNITGLPRIGLYYRWVK